MSGSKTHRDLSLRMTAFAAVASFAVLAPQPAASSPQSCRQLESQLASLGRPVSGGQVRRYDKAIRAQELELEKTRTLAANAGCGGFFGALRGQCGSLNATISRMENNLTGLRQQRALLVGGGDPRREKARILAELDANGCRATRDASLRNVPELRESQPKLFEELFGGKVRHRQRLDDSPETDGGLRGSVTASGNYRTLCVRACDGYFFPIAYSSSPKNFERDARACEAACPGTEVELFRHRAPAEEAEQAVSVRTGLPYADLPNAFLYRRTDYARPEACGCNPPKGFSVVAGNRYEREGPVEAVVATTVSAEVGADLEDEADDRAGDAAIAEAPDLFAIGNEAETATSSIEDEKPAERRVRVVGPMFLPDPEGAIDLQAPARRLAR